MSEELAGAADSGAAGMDGGSEPTGGFDIETASNDLAGDLFPRAEDDDDPPADIDPPADKAGEDDDKAAKPDAAATDKPAARAAPQSWKREMHEHFAKLDPVVQDYIEQREKQMADGLEKDRGDANLGRVMRDIMTPYAAMLKASGIDEPRAVSALLNAHYKLSNLQGEAKLQYFAGLAQNYGIDLAGLQQYQPQQVDPHIRNLQQRFDAIEQSMREKDQAIFLQAHARVTKDVDAFAAAHPMFDDVASEIAAFLQADPGVTLEQAYEKAVWANPVTRAKEVARLQQEHEAQLRKQAQDEAEKARAAAAASVRSRDTRRTPTGSRATMKDLDSAMREAMAEIKSRH